MDKLTDGLFEEYRILQNKIDKIADFELKVRGWCITLESAIILSIVSGKIHFASPVYPILLVTLIIFVFQFLEQEQLETKKVLSKRALIVEHAIDRLIVSRNEPNLKKEAINKNVFKLLQGAPRTAITLRNFGRTRFSSAMKNMFTLKTHFFYYVQYAAIVVLMIASLFGSFHTGETGSRIEKINIEHSCLKSH